MRTAVPFLAIVLCVAMHGPAPAAPDETMASLAFLPDAEWSTAHAAHLLRRAGFGGTLAEVEALHSLGLNKAVERLLDWDGPDDNAPGLSLAVTSRPGRKEMSQATTQEERQQIQRDYRRRDQFQYTIVREWWIQTMIRTAHPLRERMVLFWHGHFTTSFRDVRNSYHMYMQNTLFRCHAAGNFRELLGGVSKDPAMLEYLDNNRNRKAKPNENYAREVMELFTLGVGNYTEKDIKEAARALTGWTSVGNRFYLDKNQHDDSPKTILGRTGNFDGDGFLDILVEQPAASRYIATRLYRYFAHEFPDKRIVEGLARTLRRNKWEIRPVLAQLFKSRAFYSPYAMGTKVKGPVEFIVSLFRQLGIPAKDNPGLTFLADSLGQALMDPPNVKGWPGGREWITTSHLLNRYNVAGALVGLPMDKARTAQGGDRRTARYMGMVRRMQRYNPNGYEDMDASVAGEGGGMGMDDGMAGGRRARRDRRREPVATYNVVAVVRKAGLENADEIVDFFCRTLLANPVGNDMRVTLMDYLNKESPFRLDARDAKQRLHGLLRLIASTPEFQLL